MEIKMAKHMLKKLTSTLKELKEASQAGGQLEPDLHLFIIKQALAVAPGPKASLLWPE